MEGDAVRPDRRIGTSPVVADQRDAVCTPSARICCAICGTVRVPSTGWPPVIATASL
jgi:hypothetical protein